MLRIKHLHFQKSNNKIKNKNITLWEEYQHYLKFILKKIKKDSSYAK